ncbi:MAG: ethylbenzene dehydrogenase-related protein [bacterium]
MKKIIVISLAVILVLCFGAVVYYKLSRPKGIQVVVEETKRAVLKAPFVDKDIDLTAGLSPEIWDVIEPTEIGLMHQIMVLPWGKSSPPQITVKAFHNRQNIYFYMKWKDTTEDKVVEVNRFSDAGAIMFPLGEKVPPQSIMMGFLGRANIWHWKASQDNEFWAKKPRVTKAYSDFYYPFEEKELFPVSKEVPVSAVNDLISIRVSTVTPKETQRVEGRGFFEKGAWQVVFKRAIEPADIESDAAFKTGGKRLCVFAVWNGSNGDRGGRKSISDWVELEME